MQIFYVFYFLSWITSRNKLVDNGLLIKMYAYMRVFLETNNYPNVNEKKALKIGRKTLRNLWVVVDLKIRDP